ncbi:MAG: hypothetical protein ABR555_15185 [Pyrinomonadaceae bacterium]
MRQCPLCHRDYADDMNYCLLDGTVLQPASNNDPTWVLPSPTPTPQPETVLIRQPGKTRTALWITITATGGVLLVLIVATVTIVLWSHGQAADNNNSAPVAFGLPTPSPTVSKNDLMPLNSPAVSPTTAPVESSSPAAAEQTISAGTYECEYKPNDRPEDAEGLRTIKVQFIFSGDGTYSVEAFITIEGTSWNDQLFREERGSYSQFNDAITFTDRVERKFDLDSGVWKPWTAPSSGPIAREVIRNVTPTSFQLQIDNRWITASRL